MPDTANSEEAYVTLVTNDRYALGALVLSQSLRNVDATRQLVVMFTPGVSQEMRDQLLYAFDVMVQVDVLDSQDAVNLELLTRPDLGVTFTKLHCWRLTQFTKCVFMDADTMVLQNTDELFEREEFSAVPDVGWPDCFNSGVFVFRPSEETYSALLHLALTEGSFDGGDQGLLNSYFSDWATKDIKRHLPFVYNIVAHAFYSYLPALKQFGQSIKVVHFIGSVKPWSLGYNTATGQVEGNSSHAAEFVNRWWKVFMEKIHHRLDSSLASLVSVFERHPPAPPPPSCEAPVWTPPLQPPPPVFENHQMMTPYVPPEVPVFYDPTPQQDVSEVPEIVVAPESRSFFHFESFYTEPSMAQVESHPFAGEMYTAKEFSDVMTEYSHQPDPPPPPPPQSPQVEDAAGIAADVAEGSAEVESSTVVAEITELPVVEEPVASIIYSEDASHLATSESGVVESDSVIGEIAAAVAITDEVKEDVSLGAVEDSVEAISEESSNLKTYTKQQLSDRARQFNWERGQIDYLGIDSFENILRQIEGTIQEHLIIESPPSQVTAAPSPPVHCAPECTLSASVHCSTLSAPVVKTSASGQSLDDIPTVGDTDIGVTTEE